MGFTPDIQQASAAKLETVNVLITGFSGGGKTTLGATMSNPLIIALEEQGVVSIKTIAPEANVIVVNGLDDKGNPIIDPRTQVPVTPWDHLFMVWGWVKTQITAGTFPYNGIVLDSLQDSMDALIKKLLGPRKGGPEDAPPALTMQEWGTVGNRALDMIRFLKALPVDVAVITKAEEVMDGEELKVRPGAPGRMTPDALPYLFNLVLYCYKAINQDGGRPEYLVLTDGHSKFSTKGHPALRPIESQNLADMIDRMKGGAGAGLIAPAEALGDGAVTLPDQPARVERPGAKDAREAKEEKRGRGRGGGGKKGTGKPPAPPVTGKGKGKGNGNGKGKGKGGK